MRARHIVPLTLTLATGLLLAGCATTAPYLVGKTPEQRAEAREHFHAGTVQYDLAHFDEAVKEFQAAYAVIADPALLYNIAQSQRLGGHPKEAIDAYNQFLHDKSGLGDDLRKEVTDHISECLAAMSGAAPSTPEAPAAPAQ